jgi:hypothetical protein
MSFNIHCKLFVLGIGLLMIPACGSNGMAPANAFNTSMTLIPGSNATRGAAPADTTSILKLLTKDITIGSTVDPTNGYMGPRAVTVVQNNFGKLKKGHVLV